MVFFLGLMLLINGGESCGDGVKDLITFAVCLKLFVQLPYEFLTIYLVKNQILKSTTIQAFGAIILLFLLFWYWHITKMFFSSKNDCRKKSTSLWFAHVFLLIEAFAVFCLCGIALCIVACIIGCVCIGARNERLRQRNNLNVKNILLNAANLRINPEHYEDSSECPICYDEFKPDQNIIRLPCNAKHYFHIE